MKNRILLLLILLASNSYAFDVHNEIPPSSAFQNADLSCLTVFPFNTRNITDNFDYLGFSTKLRDSIVRGFQERTSLKPVTSRDESLQQSIKLNVVHGDLKVNDYFERTDSNDREQNSNPYGTSEMRLSGTVDNFVPGRNTEDGFLRITFVLIDSRSKVVQWTSTMDGRYQDVVTSLVDSINQRKFVDAEKRTEPWVNPSTERPHLLALSIDAGTFNPLDKLRGYLADTGTVSLGLSFTLPFLRPFENRITAGISFAQSTPLDSGISRFVLPLEVLFIYHIPLAVRNLNTYPIAGIGLIWENSSYPGYQVQIDERNFLSPSFSLGWGVEFVLNPSGFTIKGLRSKTYLIYSPNTAVYTEIRCCMQGFGGDQGNLPVSLLFNWRAGFKIRL